MSNLVKKRLQKTRWMGKFLQSIPFVRTVILNGSLAEGRAKDSSDIDLLIVARKGRIFTTRFLVNFLGIITLQKRPKDENKPHGGKFCFNYFMSDDYLKIPTDRSEKIDRYCAENYSKSIFVAGDIKIFYKFFEKNKELFQKYPTCASPKLGEEMALCNYSPLNFGGGRGDIKGPRTGEACLTSRRVRWGTKGSSLRVGEVRWDTKGSSPRVGEVRWDTKGSSPRVGEVRWGTNIIKSLLESLLLGKFGDWLEQKLKVYQIKKIESDPRTQKYPTLIVYTDQELRFHPPKSHNFL